MMISSKGRYALHVMVDLAQHTNEGLVSLKAVAERQGLSLKYLENIVSVLTHAGLLNGQRGKVGGYRLTRRPEEYPVGEILRCMEGNLAPVSCINSDGSINCDKAPGCLTAPMWVELDEIINKYLNSITLAQLISGEKWKKV